MWHLENLKIFKTVATTFILLLIWSDLIKKTSILLTNRWFRICLGDRELFFMVWFGSWSRKKIFNIRWIWVVLLWGNPKKRIVRFSGSDLLRGTILRLESSELGVRHLSLKLLLIQIFCSIIVGSLPAKRRWLQLTSDQLMIFSESQI